LIKAELKKTVHIISLSGSAVIVARKRLEAEEKSPTHVIQSYSKRLGSNQFMYTYFPVVKNFH